MERLRTEEEDVIRQVSAALEKENIDREMKLEGADSASLFHDIEELRAKLAKFEARKSLITDFPAVEKAREGLLACYK